MAKSIETQRPEPILSDRKAVEIAESLDYDFSKYEKGWASQLGCVFFFVSIHYCLLLVKKTPV
jgi:O-methyltransferase involved in polyketide biosynthesis